LTLLVLMFQVLPDLTEVFLFLLISDMTFLPLIPMKAHDSLILRFQISLDPIVEKIYFIPGVNFLEHSSLHATAMMDPAGTLAKSFIRP